MRLIDRLSAALISLSIYLTVERFIEVNLYYCISMHVVDVMHVIQGQPQPLAYSTWGVERSINIPGKTVTCVRSQSRMSAHALYLKCKAEKSVRKLLCDGVPVLLY